MEKLLQLNEFFVEGGHQEISHVLLNLIQPTSETEEKEKGYFFAICEINQGNSQQIAELQRIMGEIENGYYETSDTENKNSLEIVLEKINQQNLALFGLNLSLHCVVGAIKSNEIVFSYCGKPNILLFYANKEKIYSKLDLTENSEPETNTDKTLFSQLVQGKVSPGDYFFVGTKKVIEYFSHDRLQKIITTRGSEQSSEHIRRVLSELKNGLSFGGLIINLREKNAVDKAPEKKIRLFSENKEKINSLFVTEQNTANTLSPSLFGEFATKLKNGAVNFKKQNSEKPSSATIEETIDTDTKINAPHLKQRLASKMNTEIFITLGKIIAKYSWIAVKNFGKLLWWLTLMLAATIGALLKFLQSIFFYLINYKNQRRQIKERWSQTFYSYKQNFKHLPLTTKILGLISLVVLVTFLSSIFYLQHAKNIQKENVYYEQAFSNLRSEMEEAENSLIYSDNNSAANLANQIEQTLNTLVCRPQDEADCRDVKEKFAKLQAKIQKFADTEITMLINWNVLGFQNITKFTKVDGKIFGINTESDTVYVYNLLTKDGTATLKLPGENKTRLAASLRDEKSALFLNDKKELYKYTADTNSFTKLSISFTDNDGELKALLPYNSRLYILDTLNNQIYRHDAIASGYGLGKEWIKSQNTDIKNGISFAIDGDLFLVKGQGEILKFTNGELQTFNLPDLKPVLQNSAKIWTYSEDKYLYILDSKEKRLIVLNKDGTLKNQYTSDQFEEPSDMIIEEKNKIAYILDKGRVFQIELK
ncbi:MAG TPA: hypothetical protein P5230_01165 [Candidatus Magasanikbacteria bacterium]|nr:hypothetical protein [Candidatus Magasanikbacteria bacterium]